MKNLEKRALAAAERAAQAERENNELERAEYAAGAAAYNTHQQREANRVRKAYTQARATA